MGLSSCGRLVGSLMGCGGRQDSLAGRSLVDELWYGVNDARVLKYP